MSFKPIETVKNAMHKFTNLLLSAALMVSTVMSMAAAPQVRKISASTAQGSASIAQQAAPMRAQAKKTKMDLKNLPQRKQMKSALFVDKAGQIANAVRKGKASQIAHSSSADAPDNLQGLLIYSDAWNATGETDYGWYTVPSSASQDFDMLFATPDVTQAYMAFLKDGVVYEHDLDTFLGMIFGLGINTYDAATGEHIAYYEGSEDLSIIGIGAAEDPTSGIIYGFMYDEGGSGLTLSTLDYNDVNGVDVTFIAYLPDELLPNVIVCDNAGELYTVCTDGNLYKVSKTDATFTLVGETGLEPAYLASATVDRKSGRMFYAVADAGGAGFLAEVDLTTGEATKVYDFPNSEEVVGLTVPFVANDGAPAAVTDFEVEFIDGALSGTFSFTAPTTLYDGTAATGSVDYKVLANGDVVASGTTTYGATETGTITMEAAGSVSFVAYCYNEAGDGAKSSVKQFVGSGTAAAPKNVKAVAEGQTVTISWSAVTESVDGGYINPAEVVYNVIRYCDGETLVVANAISETSVTNEVPEAEGIQAYTYEVTAEYDNIKSAPATSNTVMFGSVVPPYTNNFSETQSLAGFTILNNNGDNREWELANGIVSIMWNSNEAMDDYLVFPPMQLEGGSLYEVTVNLASQSTDFTEAIEVVYGTELSAEGLNKVALDCYEFSHNTFEDVSAYVIPEESGVYFIAVHGISEPDQYNINIAAVAVSGAKSALIPAAVEDFTVEAVAPFQTKANISFTAPSKNMKGEALTTIDKIEIFRGETSVKTFTNVAAGEAVTYTDDAGVDGTYEYSVVPSNASGEGPAVSASVYVGATKPGAVAKPSIEQIAVGKVKVSWEAVTVDVNGDPMPEGVVTYTVLDSAGEIVAENLTATSYEIQVCDEGEQVFAQYAVVAVTAAGNGKGEYSDMIPVGTPYTEYDESFADADLHYIMAIINTNGAPTWSILSDDYFADMTSADNDGGMLAMKGYIDDESFVVTGLITIPAEGNPAFFFKSYNIIGNDGTPDDNLVIVEVLEEGAAEPVELFSSSLAEMGGTEQGWVQGVVNLEAYKGKTVQIYIGGCIKIYSYVMFDMFRVGQFVDNDLAVTSIKAPAKVAPGDDYVVDVKVANEGAKAAGAFTVELYADDELVESEPYDALAVGASVTATFGVTCSPIAADPIALQAKVVYEADENTANNESKVIEIIPTVSSLPYVTDLAGECSDGKAALTWTAPDASSVVVGGNVDFEDGVAGEGSYAGWIFVDGDESPVGGFQGIDVPGITPGTTLASFFIFDASLPRFNENFAAHSGDKFLAAMYRDDDGTTDDWAISPELSGTKQTVSLWAKSFNTGYPEKIGFYYSTGSTDPADFIVVTEPFVVNTKEWTEYTFEVPDGAKRFAICSCATGSFMLMIDDVEFSPAGADGVTITGYDVYRDAVKINDAPVAETAYTDAVEPGTYAYNVITIYNIGVSRASNTASVTVTSSGLSDLAAGLKISAVDGNIIVRGAAGKAIAINTVDGKTIFSTASAGAQVKVAVSQGIYLVKAGETIAKVIVK